jgi:uncharacterized membrane protein YdjX (TVP38/TMEM64 family)
MRIHARGIATLGPYAANMEREPRHRSATRVAFLAAAIVLTFMIATFALATWLGYADEAWFRSVLESLATERGRTVAGAVIVALLALDLVLPLPSSLLMMLAGSMFGAAAGTALAFVGSFLSATLGFVLCRRFGLPAFERLCGVAETARLAAILARLSPWLVLATRPAPLLAELAACAAGIAAWPASRFFLCVTLGTLPVAGIYAVAGARATTATSFALAVGIGLPIAGFALGSFVVRRRHPLE